MWKTVWQFLKTLNIQLTYDPASPLLGIYSKELKEGSQKDYLYIYVHSGVIHNS